MKKLSLLNKIRVVTGVGHHNRMEIAEINCKGDRRDRVRTLNELAIECIHLDDLIISEKYPRLLISEDVKCAEILRHSLPLQ